SAIAGYLAVSSVTQPINSVSLPASPISNEPATLLFCHDAHLDFGIVEQGGYREVFVWLENRTAEPVEIAALSTSCDCFEINLEGIIVPAGDRAKAVVKVDVRDEHSVRGSVRLRAVLIATAEESLAIAV